MADKGYKSLSFATALDDSRLPSFALTRDNTKVAVDNLKVDENSAVTAEEAFQVLVNDTICTKTQFIPTHSLDQLEFIPRLRLV